MPFVEGHKLSIGNKGGGRKGYEWEADQLNQMRKHVAWLFAYIDAVRKGKNTERMDKAFQRLEKVLLKEMDKLHANKQQTEITGAGGLPFTIIEYVKPTEPTSKPEENKV